MNTLVTGPVLDENLELTLDELCRACLARSEHIVTLVEEGILQPRRGDAPDEWRFTGIALQRASRALRLQRDLELNLAGVALALDLLDEIDELRLRLRQLELES